jgi:phage protein D
MAPPSTPTQTPASPSTGNAGSAVFYKYRLGLEGPGGKKGEEFLAQVREVVVEESLYAPSRYTIQVDNPYGPGYDKGEPGKYTNEFKPGDTWGVFFMASMAEPAVFSNPYSGRVIRGKSVRIEGDFNPNTQGPIKIIGYDNLYSLTEGIHNRTFLNQSHSDIVRKIASEVGISVNDSTIDEDSLKSEYLLQADETNMQFLRKLAAMNAFELFVQCDDEGDPFLHFHKPREISRLDLTWGENIRNIKPYYVKLPVDYVQVSFWDVDNKEIKTVLKKRTDGKTEITTGWDSIRDGLSSANGTATCKVVGSFCTSDPEAMERVAQSICNEYQGQFMCAKVEAEGNADIRPGRVIHLPEGQKGPIGNFAGDYYVTETRHEYVNGVLTTKFTITDKGGYSMLAHNLSTENRPKAGQANLVGIVTNNRDDKNMGRVKVKFPTLEDKESYWARMTTLGGGKDRGFDCLPEIDDEVLVAFEHGDINRPYIIGSVWNGKDNPPENVKNSVTGNGKGKVRLRTFKTRVGHKMQFVDEDGGDGKHKGVYLETQDRFKVKMDDTNEEIVLETRGKLSITLNDKRKSIELKAGKSTITLDPSGIEIDGVSVRINGL